MVKRTARCNTIADAPIKTYRVMLKDHAIIEIDADHVDTCDTLEFSINDEKVAVFNVGEWICVLEKKTNHKESMAP